MRITARQLRQIVKEELARSMNEEDGVEMGSADVKLPGSMSTRGENLPGTASTKYGGYDVGMSSTSSRVLDRIDSILTIDNQDTRDLLDNPKVKSELSRIIDGKYALRMGASSPTVSVVKALLASALNEIHDSIASQSFGAAEKIDLHATVTKLLLDGIYGAPMGDVRAACAAAVSYLGMGDGVPMASFDQETADAVVLYQIISGLKKPDAVVGQETLTSLASTDQSYKMFNNLNTTFPS